MSIARIVVPGIPAGAWLCLSWRFDPAAAPAEVKRLAALIRQGCQQQRYWLRAYAALPDRLSLLLYPLEDAAALLLSLDQWTGAAPEKVRAIRDDAGLERSARYIESLPVRSHLAARPEDYPWSSVGWLREFTPIPAARSSNPRA